MMRLALLLLLLSFPGFSVLATEADPLRDYPFSVGAPTDSRIIVRSSIALNKLGYDLFNHRMIDRLPERSVPWVEPLWSFFWTFNFTMWPHDFGHWVRANQVGGNFVIEEYGFPFPLARMDVPADATSLDRTMMSAGGFEINTLMRKYTEDRFFQTGSRDTEDMVHGFIQTALFPMYTVLIAPTDPDKVSTWGDTYGDPVDIAKQVYLNYSGRPAIRADQTVDPELASLYREMFWASIVSILIDPLSYKMAQGFTQDLRTQPKIHDPWLYESDRFSWSYTSRFNTGALGYEVYLTQHMRIATRYFSIYLREGRPFKNRGAGLNIPGLLSKNRFSLNGAIEVWDQDLFGKGAMVVLSPAIQLSPHSEVSLDLHWKDRGYAVGHRLQRNIGVMLHSRLKW